ncbi:2-nitropropane dioxygenase [Mycena metata]|uniref:2-nitropropane dioxygenase n=1 Tax=Mycena metata TaxID=1033252 RepID=A0AAD7GT52_9AGAR|nr:2-nitropropane dioxygenase [Mycena metata]
MIPINTRLTERLNIKTPIICAPMPFADTPELAAAVTSAGGLGNIGAVNSSTAVLKDKIQKIRTALKIANGAPVPIAVGFIGWILDRTEATDDPRLGAVLDERPTAVWFAFGVDLYKYVDTVHAHDKKSGRKTFVFVIVSSVEDARRAAAHGVDAVVVQGTEAGGHGGAEAPPLLTLLQAVLHEFKAGGGPLVVTAGGISTGAQIAALLTMGADGVVLGTRFLFTDECEYSPAKKDVLLKADLNATVRAMVFDEVGRTMGWPPKCDGRAIANKLMEDYTTGLTLEERLQKFDEGAKNGDNERLIVWAGVGAGLVDEIKGAADVVRELHEDAVEHLQRATKFLS